MGSMAAPVLGRPLAALCAVVFGVSIARCMPYLGDHVFELAVANRTQATLVVVLEGNLVAPVEVASGEEGALPDASTLVGYRGEVTVMTSACTVVATMRVPSDKSLLVVDQAAKIEPTSADFSRLPPLHTTRMCSTLPTSIGPDTPQPT